MKRLLSVLGTVALISLSSTAAGATAYDMFEKLLPNDRSSAAHITGSEYDCKNFSRADGAVYRATVTGEFHDPHHSVSNVACFKTADACDAFLKYMRGYYEQTNSAACELRR